MPVSIRSRSRVIVLLVIVLAATIAFAVPGRAVAQDGTPAAPTESTPAPATLTVSGHGTVIAQPDTARITFGVTIDGETLAAAQSEATVTMSAILAEVEGAGVAERDIQTVDYRVDILYDYDDDGDVSRILGYQVSNSVSVTVRDLDALGALLDAVVAQGANDVYGISFFLADTTAAARQARTAAVDDAMTKATDIAAAAGLQISRVVSIAERSSPPPTPVDFDAADVAESAPSSVPVQAGSTEITADVDMTFELEPAV